MFDPNDLEFIDVYSEEQSEELGIDYLGSSMSEPDNTTQIQSVATPLDRSSNPPRNTRKSASPRTCNHFGKLGVSSIIFNMSNGSTYELVITKRG